MAVVHREEHDRQRQKHQQRDPALGECDGKARQRQTLVIDAIRAYRIEARVGADGRRQSERERSHPIGFCRCRLATRKPTPANGIMRSGWASQLNASSCASADNGTAATTSASASRPRRSATGPRIERAPSKPQAPRGPDQCRPDSSSEHRPNLVRDRYGPDCSARNARGERRAAQELAESYSSIVGSSSSLGSRDARDRDREVLDREPGRVEHRRVVGDSRPGASPASTAPSCVTSLAVDQAGLDGMREVSRVACLFPLVAKQPQSRAGPLGSDLLPVVAEPRRGELRGRDLGLAGAVGAHQAHVLARGGASPRRARARGPASR